MAFTIALDIGGTFTDLIAFDDVTKAVHHAKTSTTPADLAVGITECLKKSRLPMDAADSFIHGSTVAINTAIERTGATVALIVTDGTRDVYRIGRGNRPDAYDIHFKRPVPYVPRHLTFEVAERMNAAGEPILAFDGAQASHIARRVAEAGVDAVAVCFLHSYANPDHERQMGEVLAEALPGRYWSLSHEVMREYREYERTSTTVLNAYVGPKVSRYIEELEHILTSMGFSGRLLIMQSNGGVMAPEVAKRIPVSMMESGPVGGIIAAAQVGKVLGYPNVIAFDMGGTTAKASLVKDSQPEIAQGYYIGGYANGHPVMLPVVDVDEIGAGGGSIAWIDEVGALKVGPQSAGGQPGPMCYGWGGVEPTITDANVLLGRISASRFLGGEMPLHVDLARDGIATKLSGKLALNPIETALAIVQIAVAKMSLAVRGVSVERGYDPRDFALVSFGGAGPAHAVAIARELHIPVVIVPRLPAHFSALGMLLTDLRHDYVRTYYRPLEDSDFADIEHIVAELIEEGRRVLVNEGMSLDAIDFQRYLDIRYVGQEFWIQTPVGDEQIRRGDRAAIRQTYDDIHDRRYGHLASDEPVEVVNVRVTAEGHRPRPEFAALSTEPGAALVGSRAVYLDSASRSVDCPIYDRDQLGAGQEIAGPAIIEEYASTTLLFPGDVAVPAATGDLIIHVGQA